VGAGILTVVAASQKGAFYQMGLAAGDSGVQAVKTFTVSTTMTTGAYSLVAYRTLANVDLTLAGVSNSVDAITGGFPRLYNNTVPFLVFTPSAVTASVISAQVIYSQG
jgi:siroheme synthase